MRVYNENRFDRVVKVGVPDTGGREAILKVHTRKMTLEDATLLASVAEITPGKGSFYAIDSTYVKIHIERNEGRKDSASWYPRF